jgi:hypothetical protein
VTVLNHRFALADGAGQASVLRGPGLPVIRWRPLRSSSSQFVQTNRDQAASEGF